jgi:hypothetical protein
MSKQKGQATLLGANANGGPQQRPPLLCPGKRLLGTER